MAMRTAVITGKRQRESRKPTQTFRSLPSNKRPKITNTGLASMIQIWINPKIPNFGSPLCGYRIPHSVYKILNFCNPRVTKTQRWKQVVIRSKESTRHYNQISTIGDAKDLLTGMFDVYLQSSNLLNHASTVAILTDIFTGWKHKLTIAKRLLTKTDPIQQLSWFEWQSHMIDIVAKPYDITEQMMKEAMDPLCNPSEIKKMHVDCLYSAKEYIEEIKYQLQKIWHAKNCVLQNMIRDKNENILLGILWRKDIQCRVIAEKVAKDFRSAQLRHHFQIHNQSVNK